MLNCKIKLQGQEKNSRNYRDCHRFLSPEKSVAFLWWNYDCCVRYLCLSVLSNM